MKLLVNVQCKGNTCIEDKEECHLVSHSHLAGSPYCILFKVSLETVTTRISIRCKECRIAETRAKGNE